MRKLLARYATAVVTRRASASMVPLDFVRPRALISPVGIALLLLGGAAIGATVLEYRAMDAQRAGLELKLATATRHAQRDALSGPRAAHLTEEATRVAGELSTPWTALLAELEFASHDKEGDVALLSIEPDHEKHRVHISAESRNLRQALAYVERLRTTHSLRYPMLDSHEVKADDPQRPVRFVLTADWQEGS